MSQVSGMPFVLQSSVMPAAISQAYRAAMEIRERLVAADSANAVLQRDLSVSHERIGDILDLLQKSVESLLTGL